jgi:hypothetical protein
MKTTVKSLGIAVLAAMLVFAFAGCKEPDADEPPPLPTPSPSSLSVINISAIQGVTVPTKDGIPVTAITENAQYKGTVAWSPSVNENETFVIFTEYTAYITLTAKAGFTLQGVPTDFFTVDGAKSVSNDASSGVIIAEFPPTTDVINIAAIKGVTVPKNGEVPITNITENAQYSGTVTWSPYVNERFAAITPYTATITLTAKSDFTLQGVPADFFKVEGAASVSNAANSGVITAVFPSTDPTSIDTVSISVIAPAKGATPSTFATSSGTVNYNIGTVTWLPSVTNNKFLGGTKYTATVMLTARHGYTFSGLSSATINEQNAAISDNTSATVKLSYTFPATSDKIVTGFVIKTQPTKLSYTHGDSLDLSGLVITLTYDNTGTDTEDVAAKDFAAKNITTNPAQGEELNYSTHNIKYIAIICGDLTKNTSGLLSISRATPTAAIFDISGTGTFTYDGISKTVTVTPKNGITTGTITVKYNGSTTKPSSAGAYPVTFDVGFLSSSNYSNASGISAGTLTIEKATPTAADFDISNNTVYYDGSPKAVTIKPQTGKSNGTITIKYNGSTTVPSAVGTYPITFDVAEGTNYKAASGLSAGTLTINSAVFTSIPELQAYLKGRAANTASAPYNVVLNVDDLGGNYYTSGSLGYALYNNSTKGVNIDLSGSTFARIEDRAFYGCYSLVGITMPNNIESIENYAFNGCTNLTSINIPNSVINIGDYAFSGCTSLTSVIIGNSVTSIGSNAFYSCTSLTGVIIPNSVTSIGVYAFFNCTSLTKVTIGNSVTSIGNYAFYGCTSLTNLIIPNSVTSIGNYAFQRCTSLTAINVDVNNSAYSSQDGVLYNKNKTTLIIYPISKVGAFIIPNTVTSIGSNIFEGCAGLTSITIPSAVKSIGSNAFKGCTSLIEAKFEGTIVSTSFNSSAFGAPDGEGYIGDLRNKFYASNSTNGTAGIYTRQDGSSETWTNTSAIITIDPIPDQQYTGNSIQPVVSVKDGTKTLTLNTDYTVSYTNNTQTGIANVTVIGIGNYAGSYVSTTFNINAIPVASDFIIVGTGTFTYDGNIRKVTITPKTGESTGTVTVYYEGTGSTIYTKSTSAPSAGGTYIVIFDVAEATGFCAVNGLLAGTLTIKFPTFNSITALKTYLEDMPANTVNNPYTVVLNFSDFGGSSSDSGSLGYELRNNNNKYIIIDLSNSKITRINKKAFNYCSRLISITIPNSVTSIEDGAFSDCSNLTSITIPNSVTNIGAEAFTNCSSLTSITLGNKITTIGVDAFRNCSGLTAINVDVSNSEYTSQDGVLYNKNKTTLIAYPKGKTDVFFVIPNNVTSIGYRAFWACKNLTSITIPNSVIRIEDGAFSDCSNLTSVTIPDRVSYIFGEDYWGAFSGCNNLTSVTFQGTILSSNFDYYVFGQPGYAGYIGDLRNKFYATNETYGTPGTYTRPNKSSTTWTKQ